MPLLDIDKFVCCERVVLLLLSCRSLSHVPILFCNSLLFDEPRVFSLIACGPASYADEEKAECTPRFRFSTPFHGLKNWNEIFTHTKKTGVER